MDLFHLMSGVVRALLKAGALPDNRGIGGGTALHAASARLPASPAGSLGTNPVSRSSADGLFGGVIGSVIQALVEGGATVGLTMEDGATPLHLAANNVSGCRGLRGVYYVTVTGVL